jgi:hypothetical protein
MFLFYIKFCSKIFTVQTVLEIGRASENRFLMIGKNLGVNYRLASNEVMNTVNVENIQLYAICLEIASILIILCSVLKIEEENLGDAALIFPL